MTTPSQPFEFNDFSGGLTDEYLPGPMNKAQKIDNILINRNKQMVSRPGTDVIDATYPRPFTTRIGALINFDNTVELLAQSLRDVAYKGVSGWVNLTGPTGNPVLSAGTASSIVSSAQHRHRLFITNNAGTKINRIYKDQTDTWQVRTAGLPHMAEPKNYVDATVLASAITLANELRTKFLAHFAYSIATPGGSFITSSVQGHKTADTVSAALITAPVATDLATLLALVICLNKAYIAHQKDSDRTSPIYHDVTYYPGASGPNIYATTDSLANGDDPTTLETAALALNELRQKYVRHQGDSDVHSNRFGGPATQQITATKIASLTTGPSFGDGLPELYDLANQIKLRYNAHVQSRGVYFNSGTITATASSTLLTGFSSTTGIAVGDRIYFAGLEAQSTKTVSALTGTTVTMSGAFTGTTGSYATAFMAVDKAHLTYNPNTIPANYTSGDNIISADATDPFSLRLLTWEIRKKYTWHVGQENTNHMGSFLNTPVYRMPTNECTADQTALEFYIPKGIDWYGGIYEDDLEGMREALIEIHNKFNIHQADMDAHYSELTTSPTTYTVTGEIPESGTYNYAFYYQSSYKVGTVEYENQGPTLLRAAVDVSKPERYGNVISNIPVLANGTGENYDTAIKVQIYRTANNGTAYYYVGEVPNGTTTYTDTLSDDLLVNRDLLYTEGGVVDNDPPPISSYIHINDGTAYFGDVIDTDGQRLTNRVRQSIEGNPEAAPEDYYIDFDEPVMGISSVKEKVIVFCTESVYRLEGTFDERGQGGITKIRISDIRGCINAPSIVKTDGGLFFAGNDAFCYTDGYAVMPLSNFYNTYGYLTNSAAKRSQIVGTYDKYGHRIWWTTQLQDNAGDNDSAYIMDLNYTQMVEDGGCFTSASRGPYDSFRPTAITVFNKRMIHGDMRGYILEHFEALGTEPNIDTARVPSLWHTNAIIYNYTSCGSDYGSSGVKKWASRITVRAKNSSNLSAQINANNDDGKNISALTPIKFRGNITWGDPLVTWGDPNLFWNYEGIIEDNRHFPAGSLRMTYKQIQLTNAFVPIVNSDTLGLGALTVPAGRFLTISGTGNVFPANLEGYTVAFEGDGYVRNWTILNGNSNFAHTQIAIDDPLNELTAVASTKWVIRGYPKGEKMQILSYTVHVAQVGTRSTKAFTQTSGEVGS